MILEIPEKTVLIVDDDADNRQTISAILEKEGFAARFAGTATEGWKSLEGEKPDLIILDVILPDMPGTDLCLKIKNDSRFQDVLLVLVSGQKVTPEDLAFGLEIGADDYIARPFKVREFKARINALWRLKETLIKKRGIEPYHDFDQQSTLHTAQIFEQQSLKQGYGEEFKKCVESYIKLIEMAIEQRVYKGSEELTIHTRELAFSLGFLKADARDVIELHKEALAQMGKSESAKMNFLIRDESRILLVELMGYLLNHYRNTFSVS